MINDTQYLSERFGPAFAELKGQLDAALSGNPSRLGHSARYASTILLLRDVLLPGFKVLEVGFSDVLHRYIDTDVASWDYVVPSANEEPITSSVALQAEQGRIGSSTRYVLNLERDRVPVGLPTYDLIICAELIQKMDVDPMAVIAEFNRVHLTGGRLMMSTPNAVSARIVHKAINGSHPSFYMTYTKDASPYRHNLEYTTAQLIDLVTSAGYSLEHHETLDVFEDPHAQGMEILKNLGAPLKHRGDDIFLIATKTGGLSNRYPGSLYA
jgi:SAM-dependent methyltransferase